MFASGAEARRRARESRGAALQNAFGRLHLLSHGIQVAGIRDIGCRKAAAVALRDALMPLQLLLHGVQVAVIFLIMS